MSCSDIETIPVCFTPTDASQAPVSLNKYVKFRNNEKVYYYATTADPDTAIDPATYLGGGDISSGYCMITESYQIMTVRLDGNTPGTSVAREEGQGISVADIGNTFTLNPQEYYSYTLQWLGDSVHNAIVDWNDVSYRAGLGFGSAGYPHASLPLREWTNHLGEDQIVITAQAGAYLELRFTKPL